MAIINKIILNGVEHTISGSGGGEGLTSDLKLALDQIAQKVAYIDDDGQDYYDALHSALYPPANLSYITCVYTQSGTVYDTDSLNDLKSDLVVTAHYTDNTTQVINSYTLSGTLTAGTSTITVSYGGKIATFNVTVTHASRDTSVELRTQGYVLGHKSTEPQYYDYSQTNGGITIMYDLPSPTTALFPAGIIPTDGNVLKNAPAALVVYDSSGNPISFVSEASTSSFNRWAQDVNGTMIEFSNSWTVSEYSKIAFSVDIRYTDQAYMYDKTTGHIFFAGIDTPYYGMDNISEAQ